jgi:hypothetical protein
LAQEAIPRFVGGDFGIARGVAARAVIDSRKPTRKPNRRPGVPGGSGRTRHAGWRPPPGLNRSTIALLLEVLVVRDGFANKSGSME